MTIAWRSNSREHGRWPRRSLLMLLVLTGALATACAGSGAAPTPTATLAPTATTTPRTAQLLELKNDVTARQTSELGWTTAAEGESITPGGGVRTGDDAKARVDTSDGSIIRIASNTEFQLLAFSPQPTEPVTRLRVEAGKVWVIVTQALGFGMFEVQTPAGVATVRGSLMSIDQVTNGRLVVTCLEGQCRLADTTQANFTDLVAGQQTEITAPGQPPQPARPMDAAQVQDWLQNVPEAQTAAQVILNLLAQQATSTPPPPPPPPAGLNLSNSATANAPDLAFDGQGVLHAVWEDRSYRELGSDYVHRQLPPGGQWSEPEVLTEGFVALFGSLTLLPKTDGSMCVLWNGADQASVLGLFQSCQTNTGWAAPELLIQAGGTGREFSVVRLADDSVREVHINGAGTILFGETVLVEDLSTNPELVVDVGGGHHAAWAWLGDPFALQYRYSADGGLTWTEAVTLSTEADRPDGLNVRLEADRQGGVHLLWDGYDGAYYRRWTSTSGWGETMRVSDGDTRGAFSDLALDGNSLARAAWGRFDGVRYTAQAADGAWSAPVIVTSREGDFPKIAVDAQGVTHLIWLTASDVFYLTPP